MSFQSFLSSHEWKLGLDINQGWDGRIHLLFDSYRHLNMVILLWLMAVSQKTEGDKSDSDSVLGDIPINN